MSVVRGFLGGKRGDGEGWSNGIGEGVGGKRRGMQRKDEEEVGGAQM